ncbi:MAG: hypothetical protein IMZ53_00375 [Thermoplasmata archaeon]|nr:hypothetical protein [Thermoplasmata archaeon]
MTIETESLKKSLQHLYDALIADNKAEIDFYLNETREKLNKYDMPDCPDNEFTELFTGDMSDETTLP